MASSSCRLLLLTTCVRRLNGFQPKSLFPTNLYLTNFSRNLFLRSGNVLQTTSSFKTLWGTRRWTGSTTNPVSTAKLEEQSKIENEINTSPNKNEEKKKDEQKTKDDERQRIANMQWRATKYTLIGFTILFSCTAGWILMVWGSPKTDEEGQVVKDEFSDMSVVKAYFNRAWREIIFYNKMIKDPSRDKLLPDPLQEPYYQPPYTLVIEMKDILVHPDWTYKTGWRFKKRPGVDFFLQQVGPPLFELVIYTSEQGFTAYPILESLDPNGFIMYKLFRDATRYQDGHHVKDLSCLNRDLSKVIMVDWNEKSVGLQPDNALKIKQWTGNDDDNSLYDLAIFLRTMVTSEIEDVRPVLQFYRQFDDPIFAFKENQKRLQEEQVRFSQQRAASDRNAQSWSGGLFGRRH